MFPITVSSDPIAKQRSMEIQRRGLRSSFDAQPKTIMDDIIGNDNDRTRAYTFVETATIAMGYRAAYIFQLTWRHNEPSGSIPKHAGASAMLLSYHRHQYQVQTYTAAARPLQISVCDTQSHHAMSSSPCRGVSANSALFSSTSTSTRSLLPLFLPPRLGSTSLSTAWAVLGCGE